MVERWVDPREASSAESDPAAERAVLPAGERGPLPDGAAGADVTARLGQLAALRQHGLLTEAECEAAKDRLLGD